MIEDRNGRILPNEPMKWETRSNWKIAYQKYGTLSGRILSIAQLTEDCKQELRRKTNVTQGFK